MKNSEHFPCIMDVEKSATEVASVGSPMEQLKALMLVIGEVRVY